MPFKVDVQLPAHTLTNLLSLFSSSSALFFFCTPGPCSGECPSKRSNTDDDEDGSDGGASQAAVRAAEEEEVVVVVVEKERASGPGSSAEVR